MGQVREQFPGGCYLAFNWAIDRNTAAKLVDAITLAHVEGYEQVNVLLSSAGGLLIDAHYAAECLAAVPTQMVMWNMSVIQSAANMLFALGVERGVIILDVPKAGFKVALIRSYPDVGPQRAPLP